MRKLLATILLVLLSWTLGAQADSLRLGYLVRGRVKDADSGKALESVHVSVPGRHHATVTNADGDFVLKSDAPIGTVEFSFLGYRKRTQKATSAYMQVALQRESLPLKEASIISGEPVDIVRAALEKSDLTYCPEPELLECFYRETVQKRRRYTYVAEAVARIFKDEYGGRRDAAALEKSRLLVSQRKRDTLSVKTQGGPNMAITCDFLKNRELLFTEEEMALYRFSMEAPAYIGDRLQFVVRMEPSPYAQVDYALYHALLYIDRETLCFTRIETSLDMKDQAKAIRAILVSKPLGLRFFPKEASIVLNYRTVGEKTRLEYFRSTIRFDCDWRKRLFRTHYTSINELVVTDLYPTATPIPRKERFRSRDYLNDKALEFQDPNFWADYNIIEPSESLEHAIGRLRK